MLPCGLLQDPCLLSGRKFTYHPRLHVTLLLGNSVHPLVVQSELSVQFYMMSQEVIRCLGGNDMM